MYIFFFSSRRRHTRWTGDWSSDVCSSDLLTRNSWASRAPTAAGGADLGQRSQLAGGGRRAAGPRVSRQRGRYQLRLPGEIGRASCRERVYVLAGADALKDKKKESGARTGI